MLNIKKIIESLVSSIVIFTFLISLFILAYVELYARNNVDANIEWKEFCLSLTQPPGGINFYMFIYDKLFPFGFLMILISAIIVLALYIFIFLKSFTRDKNMFAMFAIFATLIFLAPLSYFFIPSIIIPLIIIVLAILVFIKLKIQFYNKYKLILFTFLVFLSYFLLLGAWIDTKHSALSSCADFFIK